MKISPLHSFLFLTGSVNLGKVVEIMSKSSNETLEVEFLKIILDLMQLDKNLQELFLLDWYPSDIKPDSDTPHLDVLLVCNGAITVFEVMSDEESFSDTKDRVDIRVGNMCTLAGNTMSVDGIIISKLSVEHTVCPYKIIVLKDLQNWVNRRTSLQETRLTPEQQITELNIRQHFSSKRQIKCCPNDSTSKTEDAGTAFSSYMLQFH